MNLQGTLRVPLASGLQDQRGEMKNNNKQALFTPEGDANANQIQVGDGGLTVDVGTLPPLVSHSGDQDKLIIWGTDSPCEDPDLEEFELLECQELEAFLVEEEEVYKQEIVGGTEVVKGPLPFDKPRPASCVSAPVETAKGKENGQGTGEGRTTWQGGRDSEAAVSYPGRVGGQFRSENDIFVSCLSAVPSLRGSLGSALDNAGRGSATDSWHIPSYPQGATPEDQATPPATSAKSGRGVDENLNSTTLSQGLRPQAQPEQKGLPQGSGGALTNGSRKSQGREEGHSGQNESEEVKRQRNSMFTGQSMARPGPEVQPRRWTCPSLVADYKTGLKTTVKYSQKGEASEINSNHLPSNAGPGATPNLMAAKEHRAPQKQGSVERVRDRSASPSSLERRAQMGQRRPWGSPTRPPTPGSPKSTGSPRKVAPTSPARSVGARSSLQENTSDLRAPGKVCMGSGIPKPLLQHLSRAAERAEQQERKSEKSPPPKCPPKPKNVRPKIITYIRKSPQVKPQVSGGPYEASTLPPRLSAYTSPPAGKDPKADGDPKTSPVLSASNLLYDKYRQEMQRARLLSSGLAMSGIRPPSHTQTVPHKLSGKSDGFSGGMEMARGGGSLGGAGRGENLAQQLAPHATANLFQPPRALRPQLGVGAVNRQPFNKNRMFLTGQKPALTPTQPVQAVSPTVHCYQEPSGDQRKTAPTPAPKSFLPKPGQSGLRPPGYSRLPAARLAAFGFVRSGSVSSVSSNQSTDSTRSDPCRPMYRPSSVIDDPPPHRVTAHTNDTPRAPSRGSPCPPTPQLPFAAPWSPKREDPQWREWVPPGSVPAVVSLLHTDKFCVSQITVGPCGWCSKNAPSHPPPPPVPCPTPSLGLPPPPSRKEIQKDVEVARPAVSSPKRCAVVSPKPQSPVHMRQKPAAARNSVAGGAPRADGVQVARDSEQVAIQKLRERCEQAKQLLGLQAELRKATLGLDVFAISTQNFSQKSDAAVDRERELSLELSKIRDEMAFNAARWERLQREKEELEQSFERELKDCRRSRRRSWAPWRRA
ncbi:hypothetical protein AGOR_G00029280 [Albula goreensis]|uniref:Uncharacterized protein n=1 Tax=Albula goreensis TaxID=1534307 RepID=A0A8T3E4R7_9TELE|nr:hypothetical protein AGOR_G00029280 [Albula goreensis]